MSWELWVLLLFCNNSRPSVLCCSTQKNIFNWRCDYSLHLFEGVFSVWEGQGWFVFIYDLLKDSVSCLGYVAASNGMITEYWTGNDLKGSSGLICGSIVTFPCWERNTVKNLSQCSQSPGPDFDLVSPRHETSVHRLMRVLRWKVMYMCGPSTVIFIFLNWWQRLIHGPLKIQCAESSNKSL